MKLIAECALTNNQRAFGLLVEAHQARLRRFFLHLTLGNEYLADDLAQETFIKAYLNIRSFRGLSNFGTWLLRIAYNEYYAWMRTHHEAETGIPDRLSSANTDRTEVQMTVMQALSALSHAERTAVTLHYLQDLTTKRISNIMQIPENTVKSHLARARNKMARYVEFENLANN